MSPAVPSTAPTGFQSQRKPLERGVNDGPLDFGGGKALTLKRILDSANQAFQVTYDCDERLSETVYFISGKYSRKAFDACIDKITRTSQTRVVARTDRNQINARLDSILGAHGEDLMRWNRAGSQHEEWPSDWNGAGACTRTVAEFTRGNPQLGSYLKSEFGLPDDAEVTIRARLVFVIDAGGMRAHDYTPQVDGAGNVRMTPTWSRNRVQFMLR